MVAGFDLYAFREKRWVCEERRRPRRAREWNEGRRSLPRPMEVQAEVE